MKEHLLGKLSNKELMAALEKLGTKPTRSHKASIKYTRAAVSAFSYKQIVKALQHE